VALQASGAISMSQINTELGRSSTAAIQLKKAEDGDYGTINHSGGHSGGSPYSMSEWYTYVHFPDLVEPAGIIDFWDARVQGLSANDWKSIYGNDTVMSLNNSPTHNTSAPNNFSLDGTNDYIETDDDMTLGSRWTIAIWLRHTATQSNDYERILGMISHQFDIAEDTSGKMRIYDGGWSTVTAVGLDGADWQHLVVTYDSGGGAGATMKIYLDKSLASTTGDGRTVSGKRIFLGCQQYGAENWEGEIGQFILWGQALTGGQIETLWGNDKVYFDE